jgi:C1A family cysteine protease
MSERKYGWIRQLPDHRDILYKVVAGTQLPESADLTHAMPAIYQQGNLGSCSAQAIAAALQYLQGKENTKWRFTPSRLFIYYNEREILGTTGYDSGARIRDGIKSVAAAGVCPEDSNKGWSWPYWPLMYQIKPPAPCYKNALTHMAIQYESVAQAEYSLKQVLCDGYPIIFGISVYQGMESAEVARTGNVQMPGENEGLLGGHAILLVGYNDHTQRFTFRNSWGHSWGSGGYGTLPYSYVTNPNLASDFWVIKRTH